MHLESVNKSSNYTNKLSNQINTFFILNTYSHLIYTMIFKTLILQNNNHLLQFLTRRSIFIQQNIFFLDEILNLYAYIKKTGVEFMTVT